MEAKEIRIHTSGGTEHHRCSIRSLFFFTYMDVRSVSFGISCYLAPCVELIYQAPVMEEPEYCGVQHSTPFNTFDLTH